MLTAHCSDSHGQFPLLPKCAELVVHSGDFLPNFSNVNEDIERIAQPIWVKQNAPRFKKWLAGRKLIISLGNHDFIDPVPILRAEGIEAVNIDLRHHTHNGVTFYGFPFIPYIQGRWHLECSDDEMARHIRRLKDAFETRHIDVLVAHAPPRGTRDLYEGKHVGNQRLTDLLENGLEERALDNPSWVFCGHIHPDHGRGECNGVKVSNAATTVRLIQL